MDAIGPAVRESWEAKRKLASGVSNDQIDAAVSRALDAGASGAKLTGAGGGGFLLVICPMEQQPAVRRSLAGHAGTAGEAGPPRLACRAQRAARHLGLTCRHGGGQREGLLGPSYLYHRRLIEQSKSWSPSEIREYQETRLQWLIQQIRR